MACGGIDSIPINSGDFRAIVENNDNAEPDIVINVFIRWRQQDDDPDEKPYYSISKSVINEGYQEQIAEGTTIGREHGKLFAYLDSGCIVFNVISETKLTYNNSLTDENSRLDIPDNTEFVWIESYGLYPAFNN